jgi:magnesium chelatase subunit I
VIEWFEMGGTLQVSDTTRADELVEQTRDIQGLHAAAERAGVMTHLSVPAMASAVDFVLEGLHAQKKISRNEQWRYAAPEGARRPPRPAEPIAPEPRQSGGKKKYYN